MEIKTTIQNLATYKKYLQVTQAIEQYLQSNNFLKLDLPVLTPALIPESYLEIFSTQFHFLDQKQELYLTPSPELFLKRLLTAGIGDCYYLGKSFRNSEPHSPKHEPEFTMLELYKVGADYMDIADIVLGMMRYIAQAMFNTYSITYRGQQISFTEWEKYSVTQAFENFADISEAVLFDEKLFLETAAKKGYVTEGFHYEDLFSQIYTQEIEPKLGINGKPTLLYDYPVQFAALSTPNPDGKTAQRFECYIAGLELGNCYSELTDWQLQEKRLQAEEQARKEAGKDPYKSDNGFIESLKKGMPKSSGIAMGVERLGMIFTDSESIQELKLISIE
ncbi:MAG: amino acid--tRNA ligase-related protein [Weeksellaceae bacterium]